MRSGWALGLLLFVASAGTCAAETVNFRVLRNGSQIGTHVMDFVRDGDTTKVEISINIVYKLGFITLYRFLHAGHELWRHDRLVRMDTSTNDDGTKHVVAVEGSGGDFLVSVDGREQRMARMALGSLWRDDYPAEGAMLDTVDGTVLKVRSRTVGEEQIPTAGGGVAARHVEIRGDLVRDIWFGTDGVLLRLKFPADDGSNIEYRRF